ncbi:DUF4339 domain-containing protein [Hyphomicrobium sp. LHD-15]|uniref:DUF4339 domain-containing protein n=1 Tax=Hyphomicrobium sp. LHD-15 TaxID=3072142 RepID=UPI00280C4929|nr:DUF4339 domain-containing protein [Hyphomicrobium sp. LHD-15]MDQ8699403.1 DUF4339 domain-containing protein [Hyphomicrobium sp. LHD-15]
MSAIETDIQWYIARDGKQHGPISDVELKKLVELSHLKGTDLVWRQGFSDWRTAASVFPTIGDQPAPSPSPASSPAAAATPSAGPQTTSVTPSQSTPESTTSPSPAPSASPTTQPTAAKPHAYTPQNIIPVGADRRGPQDFRPEPIAPRAAANPLRTEGPFTGPGGPAPLGQRTTTDSRKPSEMVATPRPDQATAPRSSGKKKALVVLGLLAMTGAGAWISSQHKDEILDFLAAQNGGIVDREITVANAVPPSAPAAESTPPPAAAAPAPPAAATAEDVDRKLQSRTTWVSIKQEFPDWYQTLVADVARLSAENKEQSEITRYLINEFVKLRRENAKYALAASTTRHKEVAAAFLANLKQLSQESGEGCYDFISRGENSPSIVTRMDDPAKSADIEAQMVAVVAAISEGRKQPSEHAPPVKTDYDVLAGELGRLGWTQADMQLFANPKELAKAPRERVCNMLKDWFTAHLAIQDPSTQERLLFETLKPVVSG